MDKWVAPTFWILVVGVFFSFGMFLFESGKAPVHPARVDLPKSTLPLPAE